jgi:hypothetical protein
MIKLAPFGGLVLLAACGQPASTPADTATNAASPAVEHGYIAKVQALNPGQRAGVLFRAIEKGGGKDCQGVAKVDAIGTRESTTRTAAGTSASSAGQPTWRVTCSEGSQWTVTLGDDGTALVTGASAGR